MAKDDDMTPEARAAVQEAMRDVVIEGTAAQNAGFQAKLGRAAEKSFPDGGMAGREDARRARKAEEGAERKR